MKKTNNWIIAAFLALASGAAGATGPVNINTADAQTLAETLSGVGLSKAEAIIAYRAEHGPFESAEDLKAVKGIGDKLLQKNHGMVSVETARE